MLTCIARPKAHSSDSAVNPKDDSDSATAAGTPNASLAVRTLTSQIKEMVIKASGAYKCYPCTAAVAASNNHPETTAVSARWGKEMEARLKVISSTATTPSPATTGKGILEPMTAAAVVEEVEPKEWVAQVEPGVLITFLSLPRGGNDLKRIRFRQDMFNKCQAQKWWTDNHEKITELYNVRRNNRQAFPLHTPPISEDEISKTESKGGGRPTTPPLSNEILPRSLYRGGAGMPMGAHSSSDSVEQRSKPSSALVSTAKDSNISGAKTEASSMDDSMRSTSSRDADHSGDLSVCNASDMETEWVEEDEPGVYITIRALPGGRRELRRVRFSRERFGEMHARLWWEENRARIHERYL